MRMTLDVVADNVDDIKDTVIKLMKERLDSNCGGWISNTKYTYHFTDSNDVYEDVSEKLVISPEGE